MCFGQAFSGQRGKNSREFAFSGEFSVKVCGSCEKILEKIAVLRYDYTIEAKEKASNGFH